LPERFPADNTNLILNGASLRNKSFVKVYVGGLYLRQKQRNAQQIIDANEPMAVRLYIISGLVTNSRMKESAMEGLLFKKALFGIWLGTNPIQESLKRAMLGRT
jgi:hypothetical protein